MSKTKSQMSAADIAAMIRSRNPLIWIPTREEGRVERYLFEAAAAVNMIPRTWDVGQGVADMNGTIERIGSPDPGETLNAIRDRAKSGNERGLWIMRDLPAWLSGPAGAATMRQLRNLARSLPGTPRDRAQAIIVLTPSTDIPPELAGHVTVVEWPLPDRDEVAAMLDAAIENLPDDIKATAAPNGTRDAAIDAAVGLSGEEAQACFARSLVQFRKIDPAVIAGEKKRVVTRSGLLQWEEPLAGGLDTVGGLENLKSWLTVRRNAYTPQAREYGLPAPKGVLLVGVPGCGKSMSAKACAAAWGCPLVRIDLGALKSKFVGESEQNLRQALKTIEALGFVVVWIDEIEKAMQGATSGSADGGVSSDALGTILNWMQERRGESFVIATANDVESLPPELLRKGRFDELFFVGLPTATERQAIVKSALKTNGRGNAVIDLDAVADACDGFTGAELSALVPEAMFNAFADGAREITTTDLVDAASNVVPLSETAKEKIERLQKWATERARPASKAEVATTKKARANVRAIDL